LVRDEMQGEKWFARQHPSLGCLLYPLSVLVLIVTLMFASRVAAKILQRPLLTYLYGTAQYEHGLRIVDKHGKLSNGQRLPTGWNVAYSIGIYLSIVPFFIAWGVAMMKIGMLENEPTKPRDAKA
jgi:hypothetical protein